jgi:hypothetical protein
MLYIISAIALFILLIGIPAAIAGALAGFVIRIVWPRRRADRYSGR